MIKHKPFTNRDFKC